MVYFSHASLINNNNNNYTGVLCLRSLYKKYNLLLNIRQNIIIFVSALLFFTVFVKNVFNVY